MDAVQYLYDLRKKYSADFSMAAYVRTRAYGKKDRLWHDYVECELTQSEFLSIFFKIGTQENVQFAWAKLYKSELFDNIRYPTGVVFEDVPTMLPAFYLLLPVPKSTHFYFDRRFRRPYPTLLLNQIFYH